MVHFGGLAQARQERSHDAAKVPRKDMHGALGKMLFPAANLPHLKRKTCEFGIEDITTLFFANKHRQKS